MDYGLSEESHESSLMRSWKGTSMIGCGGPSFPIIEVTQLWIDKSIGAPDSHCAECITENDMSEQNVCETAVAGDWPIGPFQPELRAWTWQVIGVTN
jgi:hypothetical protein